jgi:hypothetical protein
MVKREMADQDHIHPAQITDFDRANRIVFQARIDQHLLSFPRFYFVCR